MTDQQVFEQLKTGDQQALEYMYVQNRSKSLGFATNKLYRKSVAGNRLSCSLEEAIELYHEAIVVVVENIREERLVQLNVKISTYIIATMKNKWLNLQRREKTSHDPIEDLPESGEVIEDTSIQHRVRKALHKIDDKCREMLTLRYFMDWEYEDIATAMNYQRGDVVRNLISRCRSKFRKLVEATLQDSMG